MSKTVYSKRKTNKKNPETTERQEINFPRKQIKNAELQKPVSSKMMTTQEK